MQGNKNLIYHTAVKSTGLSGGNWGWGAEVSPLQELQSPHISAPSAAISLQAANLQLSLITSMGFLGPGFLVPLEGGAGGDANGDPKPSETAPPKQPALRPHITHFMPCWVPPVTKAPPSPHHGLSFSAWLLPSLLSPISGWGRGG